AVSFARVPEVVIRAAVEETTGLLRPRPDAAIDFFGKRYSYFRQFVPAWLQTLTFHAHDPAAPVLRAVNIIRTLDRTPTPRPVPKGGPAALLPGPRPPFSRGPGATAGPPLLRFVPPLALAQCSAGGRCLGGTQSPLCRSRDVSHSRH